MFGTSTSTLMLKSLKPCALPGHKARSSYESAVSPRFLRSLIVAAALTAKILKPSSLQSYKAALFDLAESPRKQHSAKPRKRCHVHGSSLAETSPTRPAVHSSHQPPAAGRPARGYPSAKRRRAGSRPAQPQAQPPAAAAASRSTTAVASPSPAPSARAVCITSRPRRPARPSAPASPSSSP